MPGEFAHITAKDANNGWESSSHVWTERGNVISIGDFGGGAFYQKINFATSSYHLEKLWPKRKELNKYAALFITTILNFGVDKYSWGRLRSLSELKKEKIILPVDKSGVIDWDYIEKMMKNLHNGIIDKFLENH